ncbi:hypothetical protein SPRG_11929 [Saprolegnia parasitica CBS 223.65]|uniref:Uncharacterized protein n=1 Tax=Saprolegnia parasitica (strain CBS 223.65) TaxID=695850 RepID=A0A067C1S7_SAPPC|nr:hypothetical protein SPRG_11929 [Saprolegnia parasitica CBS 223.65]KDO23085.1 hypothetical protein SPRG_11929 [Saprolegnia parasitica CBS 223.65]|eukprot:XP_012206197.1 hypothetical protein SPRG_11929 [Saprolegnia parasitica CBS 223.65]
MSADLKCQYKTGKCFKERTRKRNGEAHSLCEEHRLKQNTIQRRSDRKYQSVHAVRRKERSERKALLKKQVTMTQHLLDPALHVLNPLSLLPTAPATALPSYPLAFSSPLCTKPVTDSGLSPVRSEMSGLLRGNKIVTKSFQWTASASSVPGPAHISRRDVVASGPPETTPNDAWTDDDVQLLQSILLV